MYNRYFFTSIILAMLVVEGEWLMYNRYFFTSIILAMLVVVSTIIISAQTNEPEPFCIDSTENYEGGVLISTCNIESGVITVRDARGQITYTATPTLRQQFDIEQELCNSGKNSARIALSTPRADSSLNELVRRQSYIESLLLDNCK